MSYESYEKKYTFHKTKYKQHLIFALIMLVLTICHALLQNWTMVIFSAIFTAFNVIWAFNNKIMAERVFFQDAIETYKKSLEENDK